MESWGQIFSGVAAAALFLGSAAGFGTAYLSVRAPTPGARRPLLWGWRVGMLSGVGALLVSVVLRGAAAGVGSATPGWPPLSSLGDRAAVVALVAGLLSALPVLGTLRRGEGGAGGWAGSLPIAILAGISAFRWSAEDVAAPVLVAFTVVAAGLGLWALACELDALATGTKADRWSPVVAFGGLTATALIVGGVNWRVWGTPGGVASGASGPQGDFLSLLGVWLVGAVGLILRPRVRHLARVLDVFAVFLLMGIALSVQWTLPFR